MFQSIGIDLNTLKEILNQTSKKKLTGILGEIRSQVEKVDESIRMKQAQKHFLNALYYKAPRQDKQRHDNNWLLNLVYFVQTWYIWHKLLSFVSYIFMYLILMTHQKPSALQATLQFLVLILFWTDIFMEVYHKNYQVLRMRSRFQSRFFVKIFLLAFLFVDQILAVAQYDHQEFLRPFLVFRCFLPAIYDIGLRKNIKAMLALYKDIFVFAFFYFLIILLFTMFVNRFIGSPMKQNYDQFNQNYGFFGRALFLMYSLSAFESYPDNQVKVIRQHMFAYVFFIVFIFLNLFLFVTIPTSLLFDAFKQTRSKIILIDQIKQQNSLILAFCCLCEGDLQIERTKFMKFLLGCFKNKPGYLLQIAKIAMQVDQNQNDKIQITQFMQILKIMHSHPSLYPPMFEDWPPWINFRRSINQKIHLKAIVTDLRFKIAISVFIILTICNCILYVYSLSPVFSIIDNIITALFVIEIVIKIIGIGPENFFKQPWNKLDFVIVFLTLICELIGTLHMDVLIKMFRCYRVALLPKYFIDKGKYVQFDHFFVRISRLITQMLMTIPIVIQFFPMYLISFYFYGVIGLQIYSSLTPKMDPKESPYSMYDEIGNLHSFLYSQFFLVQVLIDAGWSVVAYDYCYRYPLPVWFTMLFFTITHFSITLILSSLIKGVTWQVYETVQQQLNNQAIRQIQEQKVESNLKNKLKLLEEVRRDMNVNKLLTINNLISRQIFQAKIDQLIIEKMREGGKNPKSQYMRRMSKSYNLELLLPKLTKNVSQNYIDSVSLTLVRNNSVQQREGALRLRKQSRQDFENAVEQGESLVFRRPKTQCHNQQQIDNQIQNLIDEAKFDKQKAYNQVISYPSHLIGFLKQKIKTVNQHNHEISIKQFDMEPIQIIDEEEKMLTTQFNISKHQISKNQEATLFLTHSIKSLLEMKNSSEEEKKKIIKSMVEGQIIGENLAEELRNKSNEKKSIWLDHQWIMRQVFLQGTSQKLVQKFQIEYFTKIYGQNFKQINRETIKPLLRFESKITYCFRNILRHEKITSFNFFTLLSQIENQISSKLLKNGSLFKFVYQIDCFQDSWFTFQLKQKEKQRVIRAHFIKNGIWLWHKDMPEGQINISEDFFNWDRIQKRDSIFSLRRRTSSQSQQLIRATFEERSVKMLFQSFETLAMCLKDRDAFFIGNPNMYKYNMFCYYNNVENIKRVQTKRYSISKIMVVILSNEGVRTHEGQQDPLRYELSEINVNEGEEKQQEKGTSQKKDYFKLDEPYSQIFEKLGKLQTLDQQEIADNEGLPFPYIINLLQDIKDTISIYNNNFVQQVESMINESNALISVSDANYNNNYNNNYNYKNNYNYNQNQINLQPATHMVVENIKCQNVVVETTLSGNQDQTNLPIIEDKNMVQSESINDSSFGDFQL